MAGGDSIQVEVRVVEVMTDGLFRVEMTNGHRLVAHLSGELRLELIRVLPGEKVLVELSPYDLSRGRIVARQKET